MANPCVIVFKGKEYSFAEFASKLQDGLLDELVKSGDVDATKLKSYKKALEGEAKEVTPAKEQIPPKGSEEEISATLPPSEGNVPPPPQSPEKDVTGISETGKEKYTIGVRALNSDRIDQDIKDGIQKEGINYVPRGRKVRASEAKEIVDLYSSEEGGLDKIESMVYNKNNEIANDTRTYLNVYLADKYNQLKNSSLDAVERERLRSKVVDLYLFGMEEAHDAGVWTESQKEWGNVFGNSPEMLQAVARNHIERKNRAFFEGRAEEIKSAKEMLDELFNSEEGRKRIEDEVSQEIAKIGTKNFGAEGKKKVDDFFNGLLIDPKRQQFYDALLGIPIAAWNGSVLAVKKAILLGMDVASAIKTGTDYLDKWYKENHASGKIASPDWNKTDYEAHMKDQLKGLKKEVPIKEKSARKPKEKTTPTEEMVLNKLLEKMAGFATKKQLQDFVKKYFQEHQEKGYVTDQRYKDLLAKALGMDAMTPQIEADLTASAQALAYAQKKMGELQDAFDKLIAVTDPNSPEFKQARQELNQMKKEAEKAMFEAKKANQHIKTVLTDEATTLDKVGTLIQGNLLVPTSLVKNIYGNVFMLPFRGTRYMVMNAADATLSFFGKRFEDLKNIDPVAHPDMYRWLQKLPDAQRTVKMGASSRGYGEGWFKGLKEGAMQVKTGQLEDDYHKKEIQRGLEPVKAAQRIIDNFTGKERREWNKLAGDFLEAMPAGYAGEAMFRLLNLGDKPFRRAAETARLSEIADIKGLKGVQREKFLSSPDEESAKEAQKAGDIAVYTNDNVVSKLVQHAEQLFKGDKMKGEGVKKVSFIAKTLFKLGKATTLPYVRTPVNLAIEAFEYAIPEYSMARAVEQTLRGNRREALDYFGKAVVGTIIQSVALTLLQNGIMTPAPSDDQKVKQAEFTGKEGYRLNLDALQRLLHGEPTDWQDQDNTVTIKGFGTLSMIMMAYGAAYKDVPPEEISKMSVAERTATVLPSVVTSSLEQSIMTGVNTALQAALKGEKERDRWLINTAGAMSAAVYPNTLSSIAKTFADENYLRETRDMSTEEGRLRAQMINTFKDRMFMGQDLPYKVSIWGEPVKIVTDGETWTYNLLGVSKNKKYQKYSFGTKMFELYEAYKQQDPEEAKNIFPMLPDSRTKVGWDDAKMTPFQLQDYQVRVGQLRAQYAENYVASQEFEDSDIEERVKTLTSMYSKARKVAEAEMFDWTAFKNRAKDSWQSLYDSEALPIPSMVQKVGEMKLKPEDIEMLNDIAMNYYAERANAYLQGTEVESDKKDIPNPKDGKSRYIIKLNAFWQGSLAKAKGDMYKILKQSPSK